MRTEREMDADGETGEVKYVRKREAREVKVEKETER